MQNVESMLKQYAKIRTIYAKRLVEHMDMQDYSPSEIDILIFLYNNENINTSKELGVCLNISKSLVCRSVDSLLKRNLLIAKEDGNDRRIQRLSIAPNANFLIERIEMCQKEFAKAMIEGITKEELEIVDKTLNQMNENLEKIMKGMK